MEKELFKKIEDALDKAIDDFKADEESIFTNKLDTLKFKYGSTNSLKNWKINKLALSKTVKIKV